MGNSRISYSDTDLDGIPEIVEENNYYPFGLKQEGYNGPAVVYNLDGDGSSNSVPYKYKYNGKELQDELGLNMYDYGARNYDPALGRWMNIDPKAETSRRFSPFTYALNNPMRFVDPDGMQAYDPGDRFKTRDAAGTDFLQQYNGISIINHIELRTAIYEVKNGKDSYFSYTVPEGYVEFDKNNKNKMADVTGGYPSIPEGTTAAGDGHTHAEDPQGRGETDNVNHFSDIDRSVTREAATAEAAKKNPGYTAYVGLPNGQGLKFDPKVPGEPALKPGESQISTLPTPLPSDPLSPSRTNNISPNVVPNVMPNVYVNGNLNPPGFLKTKFKN